MRYVVAFLLLLACVNPGCSCGEGDIQQRDAQVYEVDFEVPEGCPPPANELGIGKPCTERGGQCTGDLRCSCDSYFGIKLTGVPCVCTKVQLAQAGSTDPCGAPLDPNFCGSATTCCPYLTTAAYCVPNICLPNGACVEFIPLDGGTP
jgi:hypothetical protein